LNEKSAKKQVFGNLGDFVNSSNQTQSERVWEQPQQAYSGMYGHRNCLPLDVFSKTTKNPNQVRNYEIINHYERIGARVLYIEDLRGLLGISDN